LGNQEEKRKKDNGGKRDTSPKDPGVETVFLAVIGKLTRSALLIENLPGGEYQKST